MPGDLACEENNAQGDDGFDGRNRQAHDVEGGGRESHGMGQRKARYRDDEFTRKPGDDEQARDKEQVVDTLQDMLHAQDGVGPRDIKPAGRFFDQNGWIIR